MSLALIIPCYNEADRLNLAEVQHLLSKDSVTIYFANDGSKDQTLEVLKNYKQKNPERVFILDYVENQGKGKTLYKAIKAIATENEYDYIGFLDADFATSSTEFLKMYDFLLHHNYQFIVASRIKTLNTKINRNIYRHYIGRIIVTVLNLRFKLGIYDTQCGAKIFSTKIAKTFMEKPFIGNWLFDIEIFLRLRQHNLLQLGYEFPLQQWIDVQGSKINKKEGLKVIKEIYKLFKSY